MCLRLQPDLDKPAPLDGTLHAQWQDVCDIDSLSFVYAQEYLRLEDEHGGCLSIYTDVDRLEGELLNAAPEDETEIRRCQQTSRERAAQILHSYRFWRGMQRKCINCPVN